MRELFRHNLENAEVIPDPSVSSKLMRKLAVREFLHFNPFRFNIYYLGGIIAAAVVTALVLTSDPARKENVMPPEIVKPLPAEDISENRVLPTEQVTENVRVADVMGPADPCRKIFRSRGRNRR